MDFLLYTLYREPEHERVLYRGTGDEMLALIGKKENPYYWYSKIMRGKLPGWSVVRERRVEVERPEKIIWEDAVTSTSCYWPCGGRKEQMCGECRQWVKDKHRTGDGYQYGTCKKRMERTDRCTWCLEWQDKYDGGKENDPGDPVIS